MSLLEKLQDLYQQDLAKKAEEQRQFVERVRKEAQIWIDGVMTPLLIKNAHLGELLLSGESWMLEPKEKPIYLQEIAIIGLRTIPEGNSIIVSWLDYDSEPELIPL